MNARECSAVLAAVKGRLRRNPGGFKPLTASARGEIGWLGWCRTGLDRSPDLTVHVGETGVHVERNEQFWRGDERASATHAGKSPISAAFRKLARRATALLRTREQEQLDEGHRAWLAKERSDIATHFAQGIYNPVALADVSCFQDAAGHWQVNFIGGITPAEYLLANGATSFPVLCGANEGAAKLHALTGVAGFLPRTVEDLAPLGICNLDYVIRNGFFDPKTHELDRFRLVRERWGREAWWESDITASRALCPYH